MANLDITRERERGSEEEREDPEEGEEEGGTRRGGRKEKSREGGREGKRMVSKLYLRRWEGEVGKKGPQVMRRPRQTASPAGQSLRRGRFHRPVGS